MDIPRPYCDSDPPPRYWWDEDTDKSLLIRIFQHGYVKCNMRPDRALVFLQKCGLPNSKAVAAEMNDDADRIR